MHLVRAAVAAVAVVTSLAGSSAIASPTVLGTGGVDTFVYQGIPNANFFGAPFGPPPTNFNSVITTGRTTTGHTTLSLLKFDLTGVSFTSGQSATLRLWVTNNAPVSAFAPTFGVSPTAATPLTVTAAPVSISWNVSTINYLGATNAGAPRAGAVVGSALVDGIDKWVDVDVTSQVDLWVNQAGTNPNNGFFLDVTAPVRNADDTEWVYAIYHSSRSANAPQLVISSPVVPEPTSAGVVGTALAGGLLARRRRR